MHVAVVFMARQEVCPSAGHLGVDGAPSWLLVGCLAERLLAGKHGVELDRPLFRALAQCCTRNVKRVVLLMCCEGFGSSNIFSGFESQGGGNAYREPGWASGWGTRGGCGSGWS